MSTNSCNLMACVKTRFLTQHNQENAQLSPDPFPRERVGSGDETHTEEVWYGKGHSSNMASVVSTLANTVHDWFHSEHTISCLCSVDRRIQLYLNSPLE